MESQGDHIKLLSSVGALIIDSHIVYTSGKHGSAYVNKDAIYPHTELTSNLCKKIAEHFSNKEIEVVIAPVIGGVILSQWVAYHLSQIRHKEVFGVYAEKLGSGDGFVIKRGYDKIVNGRNVLVVEDVLNTGGSVKKVVKAVRSIGGKIIGLGAFCNRGGVSHQEVGDVPEIFSLFNIKLDAWEETKCPLCKSGVPINIEVGKGREYLAKKSGQSSGVNL
ncbi:MAG: phosphoribosyltransferase [Deltaproteobacteria bacterium]|nr:phosphoribosyltransferase [Deltaproteobacteria bacterium]